MMSQKTHAPTLKYQDIWSTWLIVGKQFFHTQKKKNVTFSQVTAKGKCF